MATRTSHRWECKPGSFDALHCDEVYESWNEFGIPDLRPYTGDAPEFLVPFNQRVRGGYDLTRGATHFFLDDYYFERFWNAPARVPELVQLCGMTLTPDFSVFADWPKAAQVWNVYRSRWFGARWQSQGMDVIPTVTWGAAETFPFAFAGVHSGMVAIATAGTGRSAEEKDRFAAGYRAMIERVEPSLVLCYGKEPVPELAELAPVKCYPTRWDQIRKTVKKQEPEKWLTATP